MDGDRYSFYFILFFTWFFAFKKLASRVWIVCLLCESVCSVHAIVGDCIRASHKDDNVSCTHSPPCIEAWEGRQGWCLGGYSLAVLQGCSLGAWVWASCDQSHLGDKISLTLCMHVFVCLSKRAFGCFKFSRENCLKYS